jgi:hypothetical protein
VNGNLYFCTRENTLEGPFNSQDDAEREVRAYIERMQSLRTGS